MIYLKVFLLLSHLITSSTTFPSKTKIFHQEATHQLVENIDVKDAILSAKIIAQHALLIKQKTDEMKPDLETEFNSELKLTVTNSIIKRSENLINSLISILVPSREFENLNIAKLLIDFHGPIDVHGPLNSKPDEPVKSRLKRDFPFLGRLWHDLTGSPGPDEYAREEASINSIKEALTAQTQLDKSTLSQLELIKERENETINLTKKVSSSLGNLDLSLKLARSSMSRAFHVIIFETKANVLLSELEQKAMSATLALSDARHGYLHPSLISETEMRNKIQNIAANYKTLSPIVDPKNAHKYFLLPITKAAVTTTKLHFIINIPLIDFNHEMTVTPIPYKTKIKHEIISDYILSNENIDYFMTANKHDIMSALKISGVGILLQKRLFKIKLPPRSTPLTYVTKNTIIRRSQTTFWYSFENKSSARVICSHKNTTILSLPKTGLLDLPETCLASGEFFQIPKVDITQQHLRDFNLSPSFENLSDLTPKTRAENVRIQDTLENKIASLNLNTTELYNSIAFLSTNTTEQEKTLKKIETKTQKIQSVTAAHETHFLITLLVAIVIIILIIFLFLLISKYISKVSKMKKSSKDLENQIELRAKKAAGEI